MDAIKGFARNPKSTSTKNPSHRPRDVMNNHMGTQLVKLNETTNKIFKIKWISKILEYHAKWTTTQEVTRVHEYQPKRICWKFKV